MDYRSLEQEIKDKKNKLMAQNWRGDLSKKGLDNASWGDLNYIQSEVINKHSVKQIKEIKMGTDIHGGFIKVVKDEKDNVVSKQPIKTNWNFDRNYTLFAILAGVRNGYGFAGCYRHEPLQPIAEGRGLPEFISVVEDCTDDLYNKWYGRWLGDHSHTYMTVKEILEWKGWSNHLSQGGVVSVEHYEDTIAKGKEPESWCGGISGGEVVVVTEDNYKCGVKATHVKCFWQSEESLSEMYDWFLEEIERIKNEHGEDTYLVISFDS